MSLRSPMGRVLRLGSAKSGHAHWLGQRLSAAALAPLGLWLAFSVLSLLGTDYWVVVAWIGEPLHAILLILALATLLYHSNLGVAVVVEDYVHHVPTRVTSLVLVNFMHIALAVAGIYSIVTLAVGGRA